MELPKRKLVIDTETTGLHFNGTDRIIEIACVELIDFKITDNNFHQYCRVDKEISKQAEAVHGINNKFLEDKPRFRDIVDDFLEFVGDDQMIMHNARFDMGFIKKELSLLDGYADALKNNEVLDTLALARKLFPGSPANLDALSKYYKIDLSKREKHGALIDSEILALVYTKLMLTSAKNSNFMSTLDKIEDSKLINNKPNRSKQFALTAEQKADHTEFIKKNIKDSKW